MTTVLRLWILGTAALLVAMLVWAFAPVLIPLFGLTLCLGFLVAIIVALARWLERTRGPRGDV